MTRPTRRIAMTLAVLCAVGVVACEARPVTGVGSLGGGVLTGQAFAFRLGGVQNDEGVQSVRTADGGVIVVGTFTGTVDFDPSTRIDTRVAQGNTDFFVVRLDSSGAFQWATALGGPGADVARSVAVATDGRVMVVGSGTAGFQCVNGLVQGAFTTSRDIVMATLAADGRCERLTIIGGAGNDEARAVGLGSNTGTDVFITGVFQGPVDFDPSATDVSLQPFAPSDPADVFVARYSFDGALRWVVPMAGRGSDQAWALAVDNVQGVVVGGGFTDTIDVDPSSAQRRLGSLGQGDVFVASLSPQGTFRWGDRMGGLTTDLISPHALAITTGKDVLVGGQFGGTMILGNGLGVVPVVSLGGSDGFVVQIASSGIPLGGFQVGGPGDDTVLGLIAAGSDVVISGGFQGRVDFSRGISTRVLIASSPAASLGSDLFLARYSLSGVLAWAQWPRPAAAPSVRATGQLMMSGSTAWVTGRFFGTLNADPGTGFATLASAGFTDVLLARYSMDDGSVVRR
jgi:hypothetical protein